MVIILLCVTDKEACGMMKEVHGENVCRT